MRVCAGVGVCRCVCACVCAVVICLLIVNYKLGCGEIQKKSLIPLQVYQYKIVFLNVLTSLCKKKCESMNENKC